MSVVYVFALLQKYVIFLKYIGFSIRICSYIFYRIYNCLNDSVYLFVCKVKIDRKRNLSCKIVVGNRIMVDLVTGIPVVAEQWQGNEVYVDGYFLFEDSLHDTIAHFFCYMIDSQRINVIGRFSVC